MRDISKNEDTFSNKRMKEERKSIGANINQIQKRQMVVLKNEKDGIPVLKIDSKIKFSSNPIDNSQT